MPFTGVPPGSASPAGLAPRALFAGVAVGPPRPLHKTKLCLGPSYPTGVALWVLRRALLTVTGLKIWWVALPQGRSTKFVSYCAQAPVGRFPQGVRPQYIGGPQKKLWGASHRGVLPAPPPRGWRPLRPPGGRLLLGTLSAHRRRGAPSRGIPSP
jgi:hypothetical protein